MPPPIRHSLFTLSPMKIKVHHAKSGLPSPPYRKTNKKPRRGNIAGWCQEKGEILRNLEREELRGRKRVHSYNGGVIGLLAMPHRKTSDAHGHNGHRTTP